LAEGGSVYLSTVNRFSVASNPYAALWGVGFLPRSWQASYVRWRRRASYENVRLLSLPQLEALARKHFAGTGVALPDVDDEAVRGLPLLTRLQAKIYRLFRKMPLFDPAFKWIVPQWDVLLEKARPAGALP
jgi:hypothetical protein